MTTRRTTTTTATTTTRARFHLIKFALYWTARCGERSLSKPCEIWRRLWAGALIRGRSARANERTAICVWRFTPNEIEESIGSTPPSGILGAYAVGMPTSTSVRGWFRSLGAPIVRNLESYSTFKRSWWTIEQLQSESGRRNILLLINTTWRFNIIFISFMPTFFSLDFLMFHDINQVLCFRKFICRFVIFPSSTYMFR